MPPGRRQAGAEAGRLLRDRRWLYYTDKETGERVSMFDCGNSRDGTGYLDVTGSSDADVVAAHTRFEKLLEDLPGPKDHPDLVQPSAELERRKQQRIKELHDTF